MLSSSEARKPRKHKHRERSKGVSNFEDSNSATINDFNRCEIEEAKSVVKDEDVFEENLAPAITAHNPGKRQVINKTGETSAREKDDEILDKEGRSLSLLEDDEALDALLLFETSNDVNCFPLPSELGNHENAQASNMKAERNVHKKESNIKKTQLKEIDYMDLINDIKQITLSQTDTRPSAPDFTPMGEEIQERWEAFLYTDTVEEVSNITGSLDVVEIKPNLVPKNFNPFTEEDLAEFYVNTELQLARDYIPAFVTEETNHEARLAHPFYILLEKYLKAKNCLQSSSSKLKLLDESLDKHISKMWSVLNDIEVHKIGKCADGSSLSLKQKYMQAYFNEEAFGNFKSTLNEIRSVLFESFKKDSFSCLRYRLKIENYLERQVTSCREFTSLEDSSPISLAHSSRDYFYQQCLADVRNSIGMLFFFQRKQNVDMCPSFVQETRKWLTDLISVLLRAGHWKDHLFILNHVLRCPGGVGEWAASYIQFPETTDSDPFSSPIINHIMASLSVLLQPIERRENFMNEWSLITIPDENSWVMIDSDDEEEATSLSSPLKENDLVMLLNQIPLQNLFAAILGVENGKLDPQVITLNHLVKLFAFCLDLIKILHAGLQVYSEQRYKQFLKRLGRLISHIIEYVTDEVDLFLANGQGASVEVLERIQVEYDNFFLRSAKTIFSSRVHGTWQYLTVVPYHRASESVILELYNALQLTEMDGKTIFQINLVEFEEKFAKLPESEQFYLLSSFSSMALARNLSEFEFIRGVVHQLLFIGFFGNLTKDHCYKNVKTLLFNMCNKHSFLMSEILRLQNENFNVNDKRDQGLTVYLWKELPVKSWKITFEDLNILSSWLLRPGQCVQGELARIILKSLNYDAEQGSLFLSREIHLTIAHIVMKVSEKLYKEQEANIIKNVSNFVGLQEPEQALQMWVWNILLRLRLHIMDQPAASVKHSLSNLHDTLKKIPELMSNRQMHELVEQKNPVACFIALMTTTLGHSVPIIYSEGFALVDVLIRARKCEAAIACIECITLIFLECLDSLFKCTYFTSVLSQLINADNSYLKLAKNLKAFETPGPILLCLENMILHQMNSCNELGINRSKIIELWIKSLTKVPLWIQEPGVIYLMDSLCKFAFFDRATASLIRDIFSKSLHEISQPAEPKYSLAPFVNWMNNKTTIPTLLPRGYNGSAVWFFLKAMEVERDLHETNNLLWNELLKELQEANDKKTNIDNCLKKACNNLQIPVRTSETLIIYRLCYQILETDVTHPFIMVLWQNFFLLYFYRVPGLVDNGSVGEKFFHGIMNQSLLKKIKNRLEETLDSFDELYQQCNKSNQRIKYLKCTEILHVFQLWLEDPKLHEPHLSLHLLPPKYDPQLFATVTEQNNEVWNDLVDYAKIQNDINKSSLTWQELKNRTTKNVTLMKSPTEISDKSLVEKILEGLKRYENPLRVPTLNVKKSPTIPKYQDILVRVNYIAFDLRPSFKNLLDYADNYVQEMGEYIGISCDLQELSKSLYKVKESSVTLRETCNGFEKIINGKKVNFKCSGPAVVVLSFEESEVDRKSSDLFNQNLRNFSRNLQRSLMPLQENLGFAMVTIETIIDQLVTEHKFAVAYKGNLNSIARLEKAGVGLFYEILESWSESVTLTPPVAALFEEIINVLGKAFIRENSAECETLLVKMNEIPKLIDKLEAHLNPSVCTIQNFVALYSKARKSRSEIRAAVLSKFNIAEWLTVKKPRLPERSSIIREIFSALKSYGSTPNDHLDIINIFNSHLQRLLLHEFPEHYGEILNFLLEGSELQTIPVSTWFTFINALAPEGVVFTGGKFDGNSFEPGQTQKKLKYLFTQFATDQKLLSVFNIRETMTHLANTFKSDRLKHGLYGLYPKYHYYVEPILLFCGVLSHSLIAETLKLDLGSLSARIADQLWPRLKELYSPWLVPYWSKQEKAQTARWIQELTDDKCVLLPWVCSDIAFASYSCEIFIESIRFFLDTLPGVNSILSHVWGFYVVNYAHIQVKDHVLRVFHKNMLQLPWSNFFPNLQDIELMVKVVEQFIPMSHSLLGSIFVEVKWIEIVRYYLSQNDLEVLTKLHVYLLQLLVKLPCEPSLKQNNYIVLLLTEAKHFSWNLVDFISFEFVMNWFVMSCDPRICLMDEEADFYKLDSLILQILKICAGFSENLTHLHPTTTSKRLMYVKANNKWLITVNDRFKCKDSPLFKLAFIRILDDIEGIADTEGPAELATLLSELLNIFKEEELTPVLEETLISWLSQKRSTKMIYGLLRSIALSAISPSIFGNIADACLNCYFDSNDRASWSDINDKFITYASGQSGLLKTSLITNGNLLTLYAIILKQTGDTTNLLEEKIIINEILQSITSVKRSEEIEPKLLLMIMHAFRIADNIGKLDDGECVSILNRLSTYLNNICNDKGNGLLSTFGLRKSETFTNGFKIICLIARGGIMKLFLGRYMGNEDKIDEKVFQTLDQAHLNKRYQAISQYVGSAVDEIKKVGRVEDIITTLRTVGFQVFNKNYLKSSVFN